MGRVMTFGSRCLVALLLASSALLGQTQAPTQTSAQPATTPAVQYSTGPIDSVDTASTTLRYKADTEGGNSGSAVLSGGRVVAIHTHAGCTQSGGANKGTLFTNAGFKKAFKQVCTTTN